ncbi:hypothetical protein II1_04996 [Bacillus cereus MC118]|uniref:Tyr recombinase domain-containing protein n=1 Tax=Bacillus cereus MC67 TaxID=1053219 RepID=J8F6H1_BACCE|nr:tyrosine-type recombinase/integrase [Bacillus cereus]EJR04742.1 hypothetical protein II3_00021 [Bacillus cereus MC67]EOP01144.1 hypothetical protein II1_04996 [Bacillus cereus MC118]
MKGHIRKRGTKWCIIVDIGADPETGKEDKSGFHDKFKAYLKKSELNNIIFHDLRHTHETLLLKQGVHPKIVSERLGHKDVFITLNRYSHVLPGLQENAVKTFSERLFGW